MKLSVSELRIFKSNASAVKTKNTIPILSYLKFEEGSVTKNSLTEFIVQKIDSTEKMLVDEKILMSFVDKTSEKEIEVYLKDNRVIITDGKIQSSSPTEDVSLYPVQSLPDSEIVNIDENIINAISVASRFINDNQILDDKSMVFIGRGYVVGQNGAIGYSEKAIGKIPEMCLYKEIIAGVTRFKEAEFSENESYYFFDCGVCKYGFVKPAVRFMDRTKFASATREGMPMFTAPRKEMLKFNDFCVASSRSQFQVCSLFMNGKLKLGMIDSDYELTNNTEIAATGEGGIEIHYAPSMMNILLKNVSDEEISVYQAKTHCYITGESGWVSLLMGMQ